MTENIILDSAARLNAQRQWDANPCGAVPTEVEDADFFRRVEAERYRQQYWQREWFGYDRFGGAKVLEIGIGLGTDLKQFARAGAECHGADITERHLQLTKRNFELEDYDVDLVCADATALPFAENTFDCVHSFGVLHHIPEIDQVLSEIHRVLKPGGTFLSAVYHRDSLAAAVFALRWLADGSFVRKGLAGSLAQIEKGADGEAIKPYVRLYSRRGWRKAVERAGFRTDAVAARQVHFDRLRALNLLRPLETLLGWYVCGRFTKTEPASAAKGEQ
jgi:ubiquinone/menaquinone biosynthesis C-methylase UbiE